MVIKKKILIALVSILATTFIGSYLLIGNRETQNSPEAPVVEGLAVEDKTSTPTPTFSQDPATTENFTPTKEVFVHGFGKISAEGANVTFEMNIPVDGGKVTGTLAGFCVGTLEGSFDPRTNFVQGTMEGVCKKLSATGRFEGEISLTEKVGFGTYEGKAFVFTKSGSWSLVI